jgi:hypothetical protein
MEQVLVAVIFVWTYLGAAAVVGRLMSRGREGLGAVVFGFLLFVPVAVALPLPFPWREAAWLAGCLLLWLYFRRPAWMPGLFFSPIAAFRFFGSLMYVVLAWTVLFGTPELWLGLGLPALTAGYLGWWRARTYESGSGLSKNTNGRSG